MRPFDLPEGKLYFAGKWREGRGAEITSTFPADRSLNRVLRGASAEDVDLAVEAAQRAQRDPSWRNLRPHERAGQHLVAVDRVEAVAQVLRVEADREGLAVERDGQRLARLAQGHLAQDLGGRGQRGQPEKRDATPRDPAQPPVQRDDEVVRPGEVDDRRRHRRPRPRSGAHHRAGRRGAVGEYGAVSPITPSRRPS